jgi:hypothetical protein
MRRLTAVAAMAAAVGSTTACGGGSSQTVTVTSPAEGDAVTVPFEVAVDASVPLGPASEGVHHVHIWFDDDASSYLVVEGETVQINNAPQGEHVMHVSLRHANHSSAGAETSVPLVISAGSAVSRRPARDY